MASFLAAPAKQRLLVVSLGLIALLGCAHCAAGYADVASSADELAAELVQLRLQRKDSVIPFKKEDFEKYALASGRKYNLMVFLTADYLLDNPTLRLKELYIEFVYAAVAFTKAEHSERVFFISLKFEDSPELFRRLGVNTLPYTFNWGPKMGQKASGALSSVEEERFTSNNDWNAEGFAAFVTEKTGLTPAPIDRPSLVKSPLFPLLVVGVLALAASSAWRFYNSPLARSKALWLTGSLAVYWFSTSGGMYNIIRGMPMYIVNQEKKIQYFVQGRGNQLGVEGFTLGSCYIGVSTCLALLTYYVPLMKDAKTRNTSAAVLIVGAVFLVFKVFDLYKWKNGYWLNMYLP